MDSRDPGELADYIAQNIALRYHDKQEILEEWLPSPGCASSTSFLARENDVLGFEQEMEGKVREQLERSQREQILRPRSGCCRMSWARRTMTMRGPTARGSRRWPCRRRRKSTSSRRWTSWPSSPSAAPRRR
ncbi:MAG: hypothetical protein V8R40_03830 [Dysosmobacter sp.]